MGISAGDAELADKSALRPSKFQFVGLWATICFVPLALQAVLVSSRTDSISATKFESPTALFAIVVIAASLCVLTSTFVLLRAVYTSTPELVTAGLYFMSVSALPLVHGITTPGVLFGDNTATMATALWSIPLGLALASPNFLPAAQRRRFLSRHWRGWLAFGIAVISLVSIVSTIKTNIFPTYSPGGSLEKIIAVGSIAGTTALSFRQVRLAQIARNRGPLAIAIGFAFVAASAVFWFGASPFSLGFWAAHGLDICGVLAGTVGILFVYRKTDDVRDALNPILLSDPLAALELGLEPIIHTYIADLEAKDPVTRDHVVRTAELALLVGEELGYTGDKLRHISLVGLLHDVGKLDIPDEILNKPAKLTDEEFAVVKRHPVDGANRALVSPVLAPLSPGIRAHHERVDGRGYPDQLAGDLIPIESRIVAVCDAYDAMANTRQYRSGMGREKSTAILREHQGAQWDGDVVDALLKVLENQPLDETPPALESVGRLGCDCLPSLLVDDKLEAAVTT